MPDLISPIGQLILDRMIQMTGIRRGRSSRAALAAVAFALLSGSLVHGTAPAAKRPAQNGPAVAAVPLEAVLAKAADYCRKLETSAFDFTCREEITETYDPNLDFEREGLLAGPGLPKFQGPTITIDRARKIKRTFVHDFRCVRSGGALRETRTLLEGRGGKKAASGAEIQASAVDFGAALLGPVGLFGERVQPDYDFAIAAEAEVDSTRVVVVDAKPKAGTLPPRALSGRAWIDPLTGDVLKIEWSESRAERSDVFGKRGRLYNRTPRLATRSEFGAEKDGIRFPTRLSFEEAYLNDAGKAFIRSKAEVAYRDYRFSTADPGPPTGPRPSEQNRSSFRI